MGLSTAPLSLLWAYQQRLSAYYELISTAEQPYMGFSAQPNSLTWAYKQRLSA